MSIEVNFYIQLIFAALTFIILYKLLRNSSTVETRINNLKKRLKDNSSS